MKKNGIESKTKTEAPRTGRKATAPKILDDARLSDQQVREALERRLRHQYPLPPEKVAKLFDIIIRLGRTRLNTPEAGELMKVLQDEGDYLALEGNASLFATEVLGWPTDKADAWLKSFAKGRWAEVDDIIVQPNVKDRRDEEVDDTPAAGQRKCKDTEGRNDQRTVKIEKPTAEEGADDQSDENPVDGPLSNIDSQPRRVENAADHHNGLPPANALDDQKVNAEGVADDETNVATPVRDVAPPRIGNTLARPQRAGASPTATNDGEDAQRAKAFEDHPLSKAFPLLSDDDIEALAQDILLNGLNEDIVLYEEKILDGRNRYRACIKKGVEPKFVQYSGESPAQFVLSKNLCRRNLTASQRAVAAVELLPLLEREAKQRQDQTTRLQRDETGRLTSAPVPEKIPGLDNEAKENNSDGNGNPEAREHAAKTMGVNPHYISDAKRIKDSDPELFEQVKNGKVTISAAKKALAKATEKETDPTEQESPAASEEQFDIDCAWKKLEQLLVREVRSWPKAARVVFAERLEKFAIEKVRRGLGESK